MKKKEGKRLVIDILLATYNGEKYLEEQIESLEKQTFKDFRILIRDDGSTDSTQLIINKLCQQYSNIIQIDDNEICGSPQKNFFQILKYATSDYIMFCDQDDVWLPNKIDISYNEIKKYDDIATLVCTDSILVNENLQNIDSNKLQTSKKYTDFSKLLLGNCFMGCTMMLNKKLYSMITNVPEECLMHDVWVTLLASSLGKIIIIPKKCMLYRQHGNNCVGGKNIKNMKYILDKFNDKETKFNLKKLIEQADAFNRIYGKLLNDKNKHIINHFINLYTYTKIKRIYVIFKYRLLKKGFFRCLGEMYYLFFFD